MKAKKCYLHAPPGVDLKELTGVLLVIEGPDSSGRSTQVRLLSEWLETQGYPVVNVGLRRSALVGKELQRAKEGNTLSPRTTSLFYATDFYDQFENVIVPALRAGSVVIADRYIFTLMARDMVRGAERAWLNALYGMALVPDAVFFLDVTPKKLISRALHGQPSLSYWESGMDLGLARDWYDSFMIYQRKMRAAFRQLSKEYGFEGINGNRLPWKVHKDLKERVHKALRRSYPGLEVEPTPPPGGPAPAGLVSTPPQGS